jgi:hypothetical protein
MQAQALEDILQRLEDHLEGCVGSEIACAVQVCIHCWDEEPCSCEHHRYWPLKYAIGRLRSVLGFEGYIL